jgi:uncharacterized surface anchored protein
MKRITSLLLAVLMLLGVFAPCGVPAFAADGAENYPLNSIVIKIEDIVTHEMLGGARFEIYYSNDQMSGGYGTLVATVDTDGSGVIVISGLPSGYYIVRQTVPPNNYHLSINNEQHCFIKADGTSIEELVFSNYRYGGLVVILNDKDTGKPVAGATFGVTDVNGTAVGSSADGIYGTDSRGEFYLENLPAGDYKVTQLTAAQGYAMDSLPNVRTVRLQHTNADQSVFRANFENSPLGTLLVRLKDSISKAPLSGAVFNVKLSGGADLGEFTTNASGSFSLPKIARGTYIISQVSATGGYLIASISKTQYVNYVNTYAVDFENQPKSGLYVTKYDKDTKAPLKDAKFQVYQNSTLIGTYATNADGVFFIADLTPGWYTVSEYAAPQGYILDDTPKSVQVIAETLHRIEFENSKLASLQIVKTDEFNGEPLSGAKFRVTTQNGEFVADVTTDGSGKAVIPSVEPGWYVISETKAPTGYLITEAARTVEVKSTVPTVVTITNRAENNLQIVKLDFFTRTPLAGATFKVEHAGGANVGTFNSDSAGKILIGNLAEGAYVVSEIKAPDGYQLDSEPQTIVIEGGKPHSVEFLDKALSGIQIIKTDVHSHAPLANATFTVEKTNGERIGTYKTDTAGKAIVPGLEAGSYVVSETIAPDGYILDSIPQTVVVKNNALTVAEFTNKPFSGIQILKTGMDGTTPLIGAVFTVERTSGERIGKYTTDVAGKIVVHGLAEGVYIVSETQAPEGYLLGSPPQTVEVKSGKLTIVEFTNKELPNLYIRKVDAATGELLSGAEFVVEKSGVFVAYVVSSDTGAVVVPHVQPGIYTITETKAPAGYELNDPVRIVEVTAAGDVYHNSAALAGNTVSFANNKLNSLEIVKLDSVTKNPLSGAMFTVDKANGERIGSYRTDASGKILIPDLSEGTYVISETAAPTGYILSDAPKSVNINDGKLVSVEFLNKPLSGIQIVKTDAVTHKPLSGATFEVKRANGEKIGSFKTDVSGKAVVPDLAEGAYIVSETIAPDNYILDNTPQTVTVKSGKPETVEFANKPCSGIEIRKVDAVSGNPLSGAVFEVRKQNGEYVAELTTDNGGRASIANAEPGWYVLTETKAPTGYVIDGEAKTIEVKSGAPTVVTFSNKPLSGVQILKIDAVTKAPLMGASFTIERDNGEKIGTHKTDSAGKIIVPGLAEGTYVVSETVAPDGYVLDAQPQTVIVKSGKLTEIEFTNKPLAGLQIKKIDSSTRQPIAGVSFSVNKMNGERIGEYTTDKDGLIFLPELEQGWYTVVETKAANGYIIDSEPQNVEIKWGKSATLTVENTPMAGLLIVKTNAATGKPLTGVVFDIKRADGQFVTGSITDGNQPNTEANSPNKTTSPNGDISGSYTTDANGRIQINTLPAGEYHVVERKALDGYELDTAVHSVTVTPGKLANLQLTNKQKAGFRLIKIDSVTKKPIYGVEFMVFDANNRVVGNYVTDNNGIIDFDGILTEGRYTIRETRPATGYYTDDMPRTVEFKSGKITEVVWENTPVMGQVQIMKFSGDDNEVNGLPKGSPLAGATFEVYNHKSGNLADRFVSGADGHAVSKPLPLGRYIVKEVQAPAWYRLSTEAMDIEVEFAGQIIKRDFYNYSANTGVKIRKVGNYEAMPGDTIRYDIKEAANTSTVQLTDFFWRDILPTDAVRLNKIVTGTYNQSLKYKIIVTTNKGDTRVIADNLSTTVNNVIDCRNAALGFANDEYATSFTLVFGTVKAGFAQVLTPQVFVTVNKNLPNGYEFGNKADVGGKYNGEWVIGGSTWVTKTYAQPSKLPRTGY